MTVVVLFFFARDQSANGLVVDKTASDWPSSIAASGLALAAYPVGVECGFICRVAAVARTLTTLRFFEIARKALSPMRRNTVASATTFWT